MFLYILCLCLPCLAFLKTWLLLWLLLVYGVYGSSIHVLQYACGCQRPLCRVDSLLLSLLEFWESNSVSACWVISLSLFSLSFCLFLSLLTLSIWNTLWITLVPSSANFTICVHSGLGPAGCPLCRVLHKPEYSPGEDRDTTHDGGHLLNRA